MNNTHRLVVVLAAAALVAGTPARASWALTGSACPAAWDGDQQQTEKFSKTVPLPKGGSLDLSNISGDVVITGGAGDQVGEVVVRLRPDHYVHARAAHDLEQLRARLVGGRGIRARTRFAGRAFGGGEIAGGAEHAHHGSAGLLGFYLAPRRNC